MSSRDGAPLPGEESHVAAAAAVGDDDDDVGVRAGRVIQEREDAVLAQELADRELAQSMQAEDDLRYEVQLNLTRPRYDRERRGVGCVRPPWSNDDDWEDDYFDYDVGPSVSVDDYCDDGDEDDATDDVGDDSCGKDAEKGSFSGAPGRGTETSATASLTTTEAETESIVSGVTNLSIGAGKTTTNGGGGPNPPRSVGGGDCGDAKSDAAHAAASSPVRLRGWRPRNERNKKNRFDPFRDDPVNRCLLGRWDDEGGRGRGRGRGRGGGRQEEKDQVRLDVPALFRVLTEGSFPAVVDEDGSAGEDDDSHDSENTVQYDHRSILDEYAMRRYRVAPTYERVPTIDRGSSSSSGKPNQIVYEVFHPTDPDMYGTGRGDSEDEAQSQAAFEALAAITNVVSAGGSLRRLASTLPFAVRFQLERAVLRGDGGEEFGITTDDDDEARRGCIWSARNVLIDFVAKVLPPLLDASFEGRDGQRSTTLEELFAHEIFDDLLEARRCICKGKAVTFTSRTVTRAVDDARRTLGRAEVHCGCDEADLTLPLFSLDGENNCDLTQVQRRSLWPMAEYTAKFDRRMEELVPSNFELLNGKEYLNSRQVPVNGAPVGGRTDGGDGIPPLRMTTRRLLREHGFPVRDRFVRISGQHFPRPDVDGPRKLVRSLRDANLCGRRYVYLFDKGPGKPNIWLFSEGDAGDGDDPWTTRHGLLRCIGDFKNVSPEKWGDRISLAFSVTAPVMELSLKHIVITPELMHDGYRFSDGCGLMGTNVARKIQRALGIAELPGAVQIRIGGCKGMIAVFVSPNFHPDSIGLRPSQVKFPSEHRILEVKRVARARYGGFDQGLFGQSLLVLDYLGVPTRIFCELQERACAQLLLEHDKEAASSLVTSPGDADGTARSGHPNNGSNLNINFNRELEYVRGVLRTGRKSDGTPLTQSEFDAIEEAMKSATGRINLRCDVALMLGVADELGLLEENEVLVGNGLVTGRVLICRSPCNVPGDVQAAVAMPRQTNEPYTYLGNVVVFSSKGSRPLPDMLGGGDLDGDEYFIIHEESLVRAARTCPPKDYGTRSEHIPRTKNFHQAFLLPRSERAAAAVPPSLDDQLAVLQRYMAMGNLVSESGRAWLISSSFGVGSEDAINMADLHQKALDARAKVAFGRDGEMDAQVARMRYILHRARGDDAASIVDVLHEYWRLWMSDLAIARSNIYPEVALSANATVERMTINATRRDRLQQLVERREDEKLRRLRLAILPDGNKQEQNSRQLLFDAGGMDEDPLECLVDVVFGRRELRPVHDAPPSADFWRCLELVSLEELREMVLLEFATDLKDARDANKDRESSERRLTEPHCYDVFVMEPELRRRNIRLAVCWPAGNPRSRDRGLVWRDEHNNYISMDPPFHAFRVANLSGTARVLESLSSHSAIPGSLMHYAMGRKMLVDVADEHCAQSVNHPDHQSTDSMNCSQKLAVATVLRKDFEKGFFVIQGPPGCGKTRVLVGIICALGEGIAVAPSNAAVANLALQLVSYGGFETGDICVYGENCDPTVHFLNPHKRGESFQKFMKSYSDLDSEAEQIAKLREFASWLQIKRKNASMEEIAAMCPLVGNDQGALSKLLASAKVVLCTLSTSGAPVLRKMLNNRFDTLLFDEAGQCPESQFYIATTFPGVRRIVVVGDPQQLPATVKHPWCKRAGYGESWMEHVQKYQMDKVHLLDTQYRMDPSILCFPNRYFYSNRIASSDSVSNRKPIVHAPFRLIDAKGSEEKEKHSYKNSFEVIVIKSLLQNDSDIRRVQRKAKLGAKTIIITPYQAQVDLLRQELRKLKRLKSWAVSTIDNIQGGEGDIVILSMVRTEAIGFADDPQRLNVALTRAKRVLRVVGNVGFFQTLKGSVLSHLSLEANQYDSIEKSEVDAEKWQTPDWTKHATAWKPFMTQRFQNCVRNMNQLEKNVAFHTLIAVATPSVKDLVEVPHGKRKTACWQLSALKNYANRVKIVWAAKAGNDSSKDDRPIVEAHFAGSHGECNRFMQVHSNVPEGSCVVLAKLGGIKSNRDKEVPTHNSDITWAVTNETQEYVVSNAVGDLPEGTFRLDPQQEKVLTATLPLLLESRSGTGKTNVLFQHAVAHARRSSTEPFDVMKPIAFITVSPNLRRELERRYKEVESMEKVTLPSIKFFSLRDLLDGLLLKNRIADMDMSNACSFLDYVNERKDHADLAIEESLVENEIGGVILGSLSSAKKRKPLSRQDYTNEIRSNVPNDNGDGRRQRTAIYDEYEKYRKWKLSQNRYDVNDVIIRLLGTEREQIFESAYLDEIQDFSYAAIFLICSIAGKETLHWVCAGDTAQMISPGCSFKFNGLKQTMLAVRPGIEVKLGKVSHLLTNYRTTKDVLEVGNAILRQAKKYFGDAIEHSKPEKAVKDLGIEVVLLDWDDAFKQKATFGPYQALIYTASDNPDRLDKAVKRWLNDHPFILTCLNSKGLEFDDVVVVFDVERKTWDLPAKRISTLRMLRELYVAVTRAKRRVVILVKKQLDTMLDFFKGLECNLAFAEASIILMEFDSETDSSAWKKRGMDLFSDEQYKVAASCFVAAGEHGWSGWARGLDEKRSGQKTLAASSFRVASRVFFESLEFKHTLDVLRELAEIPPWQPDDDDLLRKALEQVPGYFPRDEYVKLAIKRGAWEDVSIIDLKDSTVSLALASYRHNEELKQKIRNCTEEDRKAIAINLPAVVADHHMANENFVAASKLYIRAQEIELAVKATESVLGAAKVIGSDLTMLRQVVSFWDDGVVPQQMIPTEGDLYLLFLLYRSPAEAAAQHGKACISRLGRRIVKHAITANGLGESVFELFEETKRNEATIKGAAARKERSGKQKDTGGNGDSVTETPDVPVTFEEGELVVLHNLKAAHLNGRQGKIVEFLDKSGRYSVDISAIGQKALKPENLRRKDAKKTGPKTKSSVGTSMEDDDGHSSSSEGIPPGLVSQSSSEDEEDDNEDDASNSTGSDESSSSHRHSSVSDNVGSSQINGVGSSSPARLALGDRVSIHGLVGSAHLNGRQGTITKAVNPEGRYGVKLDPITPRGQGTAEGEKAVRAVNLRKVQPRDDRSDAGFVHKSHTLFERDHVERVSVGDDDSSDSSGDMPDLLQGFASDDSDLSRDTSSRSSSSQSMPVLVNHRDADRNTSHGSSDDDDSDESMPSLTSRGGGNTDSSSEDSTGGDGDLPPLMVPGKTSDTSSSDSDSSSSDDGVWMKRGQAPRQQPARAQQQQPGAQQRQRKPQTQKPRSQVPQHKPQGQGQPQPQQRRSQQQGQRQHQQQQQPLQEQQQEKQDPLSQATKKKRRNNKNRRRKRN